MKVIVLIIVIILISLFIIQQYRYKFKGGEFLKYRIDSSFIVPSISQIEVIDNMKKTNEITIYDYLISRCLARLERMGSFQWIEGNAFWTKIDEPHLVSDAHLDLQCLSLSLPITNALAACEWHGDEFRAEGNALISIYNNNFFNIVKADTYPQYEERYLCYSKTFDDSIEHIPDEIIDNLNSVIDYYRDNEISKRLYTKSDILEMMSFEANSIQLKRLLKSYRVSVNDSKDVILFKLDKELRILRYAQTHSDEPNIEIYIEYSYGKDRQATEIFAIVHKHAIEVIKRTVSYYETIRTSKPLFIACYRFQLEVNRKIQYPSFPNHQNTVDINSSIGSIHIDIYDECQYQDVMIPPTKEDFSYDEQLYFTLNEIKYSVQIEHSENGRRHKSNFVEFLARNLVKVLTIDNLRQALAHTSYLRQNGTMNCKLIEKGVVIESSQLYKVFGNYASDLLVIVNTENTD